MATENIFIHQKEIKTIYAVKGLVLYQDRIHYKCEVLNTEDVGTCLIDLDDVGDLNRTHKKYYYSTIENILSDGKDNS